MRKTIDAREQLDVTGSDPRMSKAVDAIAGHGIQEYRWRKDMKKTTRFAKSIFAGLILGACSLSAQASLYEDGLMAYAVGNFEKAGSLFMQAADKGDAGAEHMLMRMFSEGKLYAANPEQATLKWTRKAAEEGYMQAQFALAQLYAHKLDNKQVAVEWYQKAADQGHPGAYYELGLLLEKGAKNVKVDTEKSIHLLSVAASEFDVYAQKGDADSQNTLGSMYENGQGVQKNMQLAFKWYEKAAHQGHALAQLNMGRLYLAGMSVPRDPHQAAYWLDLAAAQGVTEAETMLTELKNNENLNLAYAL
jgi:TPR repeat protein